MIISLVILQGGARVIGKSSARSLYHAYSKYGSTIDRSFYFLHMLKGTMMLHFNVFVSIAITFYYMYQGEYQTIQNYFYSNHHDCADLHLLSDSLAQLKTKI